MAFQHELIAWNHWEMQNHPSKPKMNRRPLENRLFKVLLNSWTLFIWPCFKTIVEPCWKLKHITHQKGHISNQDHLNLPSHTRSLPHQHNGSSPLGWLAAICFVSEEFYGGHSIIIPRHHHPKTVPRNTRNEGFDPVYSQDSSQNKGFDPVWHPHIVSIWSLFNLQDINVEN